MGRATYGSSTKKTQDETLKEQRKMPVVIKSVQSPSDSDIKSRKSTSDSDSDSRGSVGVDGEDEVQVACDSNYWKPLKGNAVTPKVGYHRIAMMNFARKGDEVASTLKGSNLRSLAERFPWPPGVELRLPCKDGGHLQSYRNCFVVHTEALDAGFRLPLHPIICDFLCLTKLCPAQLRPNSWRFLLAFLLKFKELNLVPSYDTLSKFFTIKPGSILEFPSINLISKTPCPANWRRRWFLVRQTKAFQFDFPMYPDDCRWVSHRRYIAKKDHEAGYKAEEFRKSLTGSKPCYTDVFDAQQLIEAGLSLSYPEESEESEEEEEEEEEQDPEEEEEEEEDPREEENRCIPQEEEEIVEEEKPEPASAKPLEHTSTARVPGKKDASQKGGMDAVSDGGECLSFPPGFGVKRSYDSGCSLEMSRSVRLKRLLPEIVQAAEDLEKMEQQLNESRQENLELKREKAELECQLVEKDRVFQSQIKRMEIDKKAVEMKLMETQSQLMRTAQKAKELFEMSSPSGTKH